VKLARVQQVNELDCSSTVRYRQGPVFSLSCSPCPHTQTLDTADMQPHTGPVCSIMVSTHVIHTIATHLLTPEGWKAEFAQLANPQWKLYSRSGHLSTIDRAQVRNSPSARDQRPNHWATLPMQYINAVQVSHLQHLMQLLHLFPVTGDFTDAHTHKHSIHALYGTNCEKISIKAHVAICNIKYRNL